MNQKTELVKDLNRAWKLQVTFSRLFRTENFSDCSRNHNFDNVLCVPLLAHLAVHGKCFQAD